MEPLPAPLPDPAPDAEHLATQQYRVDKRTSGQRDIADLRRIAQEQADDWLRNHHVTQARLHIDQSDQSPLWRARNTYINVFRQTYARLWGHD